MRTAAIGRMREEDWVSLAASTVAGRCILMLGPAAFTAEFDGELLPVAVGMAGFVRDRLGPEYAELDPLDPWSVAQAAITKEDAHTLRRWVREFYEQHDTVSPVLRKLASLPFPLVVNTSPGFSAERALKEVKPDTHVDHYDRNGPTRRELPDATLSAPVLYQLFGTLEQPASVLVSDKDRLDFLVAVISENPPLPRKLTSALRDPRHSFLFLGFELASWQLRMLMYVVLRDVQRDNKSFALELDRADLDEQAVRYYLRGHKVHFVGDQLADFVDELMDRAGTSQAAAAAATEPAVEPGAPTVFLCHAHEDEGVARRLATELRENNVDVWLDRDSLRGGDRWDAEIERVLTRDVDYVVVVQSRSLAEKDIGYVNKEIAIAIGRQTYFRPPRIFVIPVLVDDQASRLDALAAWQTIDLTVAGGDDELIRAIKRDVDAARREPL
jgi:TIR domain/SIR2-like domain